MLKRKTIKCDLCVVGGGMSGLCTAISASREGLNVVLMHERGVLGGNASSEIRMWICGAKGENNRETGIIEEIALENAYRNPTKSYAVWDTVLYDFVKREKNLTLLLNCTCMDAKCEKGEFADGRDTIIKQVTGYQMTTQSFIDVEAKFYCDSSGDSILAPLTGAKFSMGREGKDEYNEKTATEKADSMTMGMSCLCYGRETDNDVKFTPPSFATKLTKSDFENRNPNLYSETENFWYLELGGNRNSIDDTEEIRDELVALAVGTWDYIKNSGDHNADKWDLDFLGFLPGKRESRRLHGDYMITQCDVLDGVVFEDEIAYGGWPIDDHFPGGFWHKGIPNTDFSTPAPYSIPYRALYSKNVLNLFFAGRNISMTHSAMSSIRVMATCCLLGEAVGKASALAVKNNVTPAGVYEKYLSQLQALLLDEDCFLPHVQRQISSKCKNAKLSAGNGILNNGQDRAHKIYNTDENSCAYHAVVGEKIEYTLDNEQLVNDVHIVFDSDLNRKTLNGGWCEREHSTRANVIKNAPKLIMPKTLCKNFSLYADDELILSVNENRKRAYHVKVNKACKKLALVVDGSWGESDKIPVISFDFN